MELVVIKETELVNKKLVTNLKKVNTAIETIGKNTWKVADTLASIVNEEQFTEDFETLESFAEYIGFSKGNLSKLTRVSAYKNNTEKLQNFSVSQVAEMLVIPSEETETFLEVFEVTEEDTTAKIREKVKQYKENRKTAETEETEETEEPEETEETEETENYADDNEVTINGVEYKATHEQLLKILEILK